MVLWCRCCGAFLGLRYPYTDWTVDRDSLCPACAEKQRLIEIGPVHVTQGPHRVTQNGTAEFACEAAPVTDSKEPLDV